MWICTVRSSCTWIDSMTYHTDNLAHLVARGSGECATRGNCANIGSADYATSYIGTCRNRFGGNCVSGGGGDCASSGGGNCVSGGGGNCASSGGGNCASSGSGDCASRGSGDCASRDATWCLKASTTYLSIQEYVRCNYYAP